MTYSEQPAGGETKCAGCTDLGSSSVSVRDTSLFHAIIAVSEVFWLLLGGQEGKAVPLRRVCRAFRDFHDARYETLRIDAQNINDVYGSGDAVNAVPVALRAIGARGCRPTKLSIVPCGEPSHALLLHAIGQLDTASLTSLSIRLPAGCDPPDTLAAGLHRLLPSLAHLSLAVDHPSALPAASALLAALCASGSTTAALSIIEPGASSPTSKAAAAGVRSLELLLAGDGMWELPAGLGALTGLERLALGQCAALNTLRLLDQETRTKVSLAFATLACLTQLRSLSLGHPGGPTASAMWSQSCGFLVTPGRHATHLAVLSSLTCLTALQLHPPGSRMRYTLMYDTAAAAVHRLQLHSLVRLDLGRHSRLTLPYMLQDATQLTLLRCGDMRVSWTSVDPRDCEGGSSSDEEETKEEGAAEEEQQQRLQELLWADGVLRLPPRLVFLQLGSVPDVHVLAGLEALPYFARLEVDEHPLLGRDAGDGRGGIDEQQEEQAVGAGDGGRLPRLPLYLHVPGPHRWTREDMVSEQRLLNAVAGAGRLLARLLPETVHPRLALAVKPLACEAMGRGYSTWAGPHAGWAAALARSGLGPRVVALELQFLWLSDRGDLADALGAFPNLEQLSFYYCTMHRTTADWGKEQLGHLLVQERGKRGKRTGGSGAAGGGQQAGGGGGGGEQEGSAGSGDDSDEGQGSGGGNGGVEGRGRLLVVPDPADGDSSGSESDSGGEDEE